MKQVGIFVTDKIEARTMMEKMFDGGYQVSFSRFEGKKLDTTAKIIPMDADSDDILARYAGYNFDLIIIPSNINAKWNKLARSRLVSVGTIQVYKP